MSEDNSTRIAASIKQKLLNYARKEGLNFNALLIRFAMERLLFRLSISSQSTNFYLKGAMLFVLWENDAHRPTKDLDLLFIPQHDQKQLIDIFRKLAQIEATDDGIRIDPDSVHAEKIREENAYGGLRIRLTCALGDLKIPLQIDVGLGDSVFPSADWANFPTLLDFGAPRIRAYPIETVVAEKLQAMVELGMRNSRIKDYYDIYYLSGKFSFSGGTLREAIHLTFQRRKTKMPAAAPEGLGKAFSKNPQKQVQWKAFIRKNRLKAPDDFEEVVTRIAEFLLPVLKDQSIAEKIWSSATGWGLDETEA